AVSISVSVMRAPQARVGAGAVRPQRHKAYVRVCSAVQPPVQPPQAVLHAAPILSLVLDGPFKRRHDDRQMSSVPEAGRDGRCAAREESIRVIGRNICMRLATISLHGRSLAAVILADERALVLEAAAKAG